MSTTLQQIAQIVAGEFNDVRVSLGQVKNTANNAFPASSINDYVTKVSLGQYSKTSKIANDYFNKTEVNNTYATKVSLGSELSQYYNQVESNNLFATRVSLSNYYSTSNEIANTYATINEIQNINNTLVSVSASIFNVNNITGDSIDLTGDISIGGSLTAGQDIKAFGALTALGQLSALRANVGDATTLANNEQVVEINGGQLIRGKLIVDQLDVKGATNIINTQSVEVSDNFIELNEAEDGSTTANTAGIKINRGLDANNVEIPPASLEWNDLANKWSLTSDGTTLANIHAGKLYYSNVFQTIGDLPDPVTFHGMFVHVHGTGQAFYSHNGAWVEIAQADLFYTKAELGSVADFRLAFYSAMDSDGDGISDADEDTDGDGIPDGIDDGTVTTTAPVWSIASIANVMAENNSDPYTLVADLTTYITVPSDLNGTTPFSTTDSSLIVVAEGGGHALKFSGSADFETKDEYLFNIIAHGKGTNEDVALPYALQITNDTGEDNDNDGLNEGEDSDDNTQNIVYNTGYDSATLDEGSGADQNLVMIENWVSNIEVLATPIASAGISLSDSNFSIFTASSSENWLRFSPDPVFATHGGTVEVTVTFNFSGGGSDSQTFTLTINEVSTGNADSDGDGFSDAEEAEHGSDPNDSTSVPAEGNEFVEYTYNSNKGNPSENPENGNTVLIPKYLSVRLKDDANSTYITNEASHLEKVLGLWQYFYVGPNGYPIWQKTNHPGNENKIYLSVGNSDNPGSAGWDIDRWAVESNSHTDRFYNEHEYVPANPVDSIKYWAGDGQNLVISELGMTDLTPIVWDSNWDGSVIKINQIYTTDPANERVIGGVTYPNWFFSTVLANNVDGINVKLVEEGTDQYGDSYGKVEFTIEIFETSTTTTQIGTYDSSGFTLDANWHIEPAFQSDGTVDINIAHGTL